MRLAWVSTSQVGRRGRLCEHMTDECRHSKHYPLGYPEYRRGVLSASRSCRSRRQTKLLHALPLPRRLLDQRELCAWRPTVPQLVTQPPQRNIRWRCCQTAAWRNFQSQSLQPVIAVRHPHEPPECHLRCVGAQVQSHPRDDTRV